MVYCLNFKPLLRPIVWVLVTGLAFGAFHVYTGMYRLLPVWQTVVILLCWFMCAYFLTPMSSDDGSLPKMEPIVCGFTMVVTSIAFIVRAWIYRRLLFWEIVLYLLCWFVCVFSLLLSYDVSVPGPQRKLVTSDYILTITQQHETLLLLDLVTRKEGQRCVGRVSQDSLSMMMTKESETLVSVLPFLHLMFKTELQISRMLDFPPVITWLFESGEGCRWTIELTLQPV